MRNPLANPYYAAIGAIIGVTCIGFLAAVDYGWIAEAELIGWIQAVGSVLAIVAAALIAQAQHWQEQKLQREAHDLRIQDVLGDLKDCESNYV